MGIITDLSSRIIQVANTTDIKQVKHDRLDSINEDSKNNYPLLIWRDTEFSGTDLRKTKQYVTQRVEFYLSDLQFQGDIMTIAEKKDYLRDLLKSVISNIPDYENAPNRQNTFEIIASYTGQTGWEQHNDDLVIVNITVDIRAFECIERVESV